MTLPHGSEAHVAAQAKTNLFLRVLGKDGTGYHWIETLFCRLDLSDHVRLRITHGTRSIDVDDSIGRDDDREWSAKSAAIDLGPVDRNLAWRAATLYADKTGWPAGFEIELVKRIPVGGGLGGGSADAGAVLRVLDALAPSPLGEDRLVELSRALGADVPFLTSSSAVSLGSGYGEKLTPMNPLPSRPALLLQFPFAVSTADAYRWLGRTAAGADQGPVHASLSEGISWERVSALAWNDFESVVPDRFPPIAVSLAALRSPGARMVLGTHGFALLSGSGATVVAVGDGSAAGEALAALVPSDVDARRIVTRTASQVEEVEITG